MDYNHHKESIKLAGFQVKEYPQLEEINKLPLVILIHLKM
jgi:hypothetical protein